MSDPSKQERIEAFLRKSLFGEELVHTQFHAFSARSLRSGRVLRPHVLCANDVLLAKSAKYFLDLLSSDVHPADPSLIDLTNDDNVPTSACIDDYGYGSDSDLDDCDDAGSVGDPEGRTASKDDECADNGSESDGSDVFVMSLEQPRDEPYSVNVDRAGSVASSETAVQGVGGDKASTNLAVMRLRSLSSRHVLVKDAAFQTWYTMLNYLYTDKVKFLPLSSAALEGQQPHECSTSPLDEPKCSAKSMYRLASKLGLDHLRDEALSSIKNNLTEHNILKELSCSLCSTYPDLLEMELDSLYAHIESAPVVAKFPAFARRIANKEYAHGADIIVGIYARILKESRLRAVAVGSGASGDDASSSSSGTAQAQGSAGVAASGGGGVTATTAKVPPVSAVSSFGASVPPAVAVDNPFSSSLSSSTKSKSAKNAEVDAFGRPSRQRCSKQGR